MSWLPVCLDAVVKVTLAKWVCRTLNQIALFTHTKRCSFILYIALPQTLSLAAPFPRTLSPLSAFCALLLYTVRTETLSKQYNKHNKRNNLY